MYKVDFSLVQWNFSVIFNQEQDYYQYKEAIENSIIDMKHKNTPNETIIIYYQNDLNEYTRIKNLTKNCIKQTISSFENEYYDLYGNIFVSDQERYLIRREEKNYYRIICKDFLKRPELIYLIREIYVRLQEDNKALFMHGNGLEIDNLGIMLLGNSGSGKTTFMLKLFDRDNETSYLSNDRVFLTANNKIDYFPIPLVMANGTAQNNKRVFEYLKEKDQLYDSNYKKNILLNGSKKEKYEIFKKHLLEMFPACKSKETIDLDYIIIPKIILSNNIIDIHELSDYKSIEETCFTPIDYESKRKPWIVKRKLNDEELYYNRKKLITKVIEQGLVYECLYNPNIDSNSLQYKIKEKILKRKCDIYE